jgi:hypothetical protein
MSTDKTSEGGQATPKPTKEDIARGYRVGTWGEHKNYIELVPDGQGGWKDGRIATLDERQIKAHVAARGGRKE